LREKDGPYFDDFHNPKVGGSIPPVATNTANAYFSIRLIEITNIFQESVTAAFRTLLLQKSHAPHV
jgi:hypothetical protein